jgi:hypothetical protein
MSKRILFITVLSVSLCAFAFWNQTAFHPGNNFKLYDAADRTPNQYVRTNTQFVHQPLVLEGTKDNGDYVIGPEIPVTGLSGYYDYQMNGNQSEHIVRFSSTSMYADYMTAIDSVDFNGSRRTKAAYSDDDGQTWTDLGQVPITKSGFPSICDESDGTGIVGDHWSTVTGFGARGEVNYDQAPGAGSFTGVAPPMGNIAWPQVSRLTNGKIMMVGTTYQGTAATDTIGVFIWNPTSHLYEHFIQLMTPSAASGGQSNMSLSGNTGPGGKAIILANPYRETGGNWGGTRIWTFTSSDNGVTWGSPVLIFDPHVVQGDSALPWVNGSCDVIYDQLGNYYAVWNSLAAVTVVDEANARLYCQKNGAEPQIICGGTNSPVNPIAQSETGYPGNQAFIATLDHPCLSISDDGLYLFVSYSVMFAHDTLNGFNKCHMFYSYCATSDMIWQTPIQVTNSGPTSFDERYGSLNRVTPHSGTNYTLYMVYQKDPQPGAFAYSDNAPESRASLIFRTITFANRPIGIHNNNQTAYTFKLDQNYPNPFNPVTKISYSIAKNSFVTIKIYDVLGREVGVLVNENQIAGQRTVDFDGSNLASGVYIYKITAGDFTDTKKMILIK